MAQGLGVLAIPAEDFSSFPSIHVQWVTILAPGDLTFADTIFLHKYSTQTELLLLNSELGLE